MKLRKNKHNKNPIRLAATHFAVSGGDAAYQPVVDRENRVIRNVAVITSEVEAIGHDFTVDKTFALQVRDAINKTRIGLKSRFDHPNACNRSIGAELGRVKNAHLDADGVVRADLFVLKAAGNSPELGDLSQWLFNIAEEDPEQVGLSVSFMDEVIVEEKGSDGNVKVDEKTGLIKRYVRLGKLLAADVVDEPAANPGGLLSEHPAQQATEFMDRYFRSRGLEVRAVNVNNDCDSDSDGEGPLVVNNSDNKVNNNSDVNYNNNHQGKESGIMPGKAKGNNNNNSDENKGATQLSADIAAGGGIAVIEFDSNNQNNDAGSNSSNSNGAFDIKLERTRITKLTQVKINLGMNDDWLTKHIELGTTPDKALADAQSVSNRLTELQSMVKEIGLSEEQGQTFILTCQNDNLSMQDIYKKALAEMTKTKEARCGGGALNISVGPDLNRESLGAAMCDAILAQAGVRNYQTFNNGLNIAVKRADDGGAMLAPAHDRAREFINMSLAEMAGYCLQANGINTRGLSKADIADLVFDPVRRARMLAGSVSHTTSDFDWILENVANKTLLSAYAEYPHDWKLFTQTVSNKDFKTASAVTASGFANLDTVREGQPLAELSMSEAREQYALVTKGGRFMLTRQTIINDDLGAFNRILMNLGRATQRTVQAMVWSEFLTGTVGGTTVFHADHSNLIASGGAAPSTATVGATRKLIRVQTGLEGEKLDLNADLILVPIELEDTAQQLVMSETDPSKSASGIKNVNKGKFTVISSPYLTDNSATAWYLGAGPVRIDGLWVCFLNGREFPTLKRAETSGVLGQFYEVFIDACSKWVEYRGWAKNPGA